MMMRWAKPNLTLFILVPKESIDEISYPHKIHSNIQWMVQLLLQWMRMQLQLVQWLMPCMVQRMFIALRNAKIATCYQHYHHHQTLIHLFNDNKYFDDNKYFIKISHVLSWVSFQIQIHLMIELIEQSKNKIKIIINVNKRIQNKDSFVL